MSNHNEKSSNKKSSFIQIQSKYAEALSVLAEKGSNTSSIKMYPYSVLEQILAELRPEIWQKVKESEEDGS